MTILPSPELDRLPQYDFVGRFREGRVVDQVRHHLDTADIPLPPGELEKSPERIAQVEAVQSAILDVGRDLGVDVSERILGADRFHFYSPEGFTAVRQHFGLSEVVDGFYSDVRGDVFVTEYSDEMDKTLKITGHETAHALSYHSKWLREGSGMEIYIEKPRVGYAVSGPRRNNALAAINEAATEEVNQLAIREHWERYSVLAPYAKATVSAEYAPLRATLDLLAIGAAKQTDASFGDSKREMLRSLFTGDLKVLRPVAGAIGRAGMRMLVHTSDVTSNDVQKEIVHTVLRKL